MKRTTFLVLWLLAGCGGGGDTPAPTDARVDVPVDAADVPTDTAADAAMMCDVGAPPVPAAMLPAIRSTTIILGGDAGTMAPTPSGGDAMGRWLVTAVTLYLPPTAAGQVIPERTTLTGTGWGVIEGDRYRIAANLELALETVMVGTVRRPAGLGSRGTFTQTGGTLNLNAECAVDSSAGGMRTLGFSRDSMDRGRFFATLSGGLGTGAVVILNLERAP